MRAALALLVALVLVPAAAAKEGVTAELTSTVPLDAAPATQIDVSWKLASPSGPFDAMLVFVRLKDAAGGKPTMAFARGSSHPGGLFTARVAVPAGGIGGIEIGLRGTTDITFPLTNDPFAFRMPLHLPKLAPGAACPVSQPDPDVDFHAYGIGPGLGDGPAYPVGMASGTFTLAPAVNFGSKAWGGQKVLWFVLPSYTGPVLIRGGRLDAPGDVRFERGNVPPKQLLINRTTAIPGGVTPPADTRYRPSYTRLKSPGCYAYQVDGTSFSTIVVFRAVRG
jgi:hypothetical protein